MHRHTQTHTHTPAHTHTHTCRYTHRVMHKQITHTHTHRKPVFSEHDYSDTPNFSTECLLSFKKPIIGYIAGFVGKITVKHTWCKNCCDALGSTKITTVSSLILFKDKGGLFKPSLSVIQICEEAETKIQRMMNAQDGHLP